MSEDGHGHDHRGEVALVLVTTALVLGCLGYGALECADLCAANGETWHWSENAALSPIVDACTCVDSSGALRRRTR